MADPDFGNKGKRTKRIARGVVSVKTSDGSEHLHYFITVEGSVPAFSLSCEDIENMWKASDFGPPKKKYEVIWPRPGTNDDHGNNEDNYTFFMSFAAAIKYTLLIEHHDKNHQKIKTSAPTGVVKDIDYESDDSTDDFGEGFTVETT